MLCLLKNDFVSNDINILKERRNWSLILFSFQFYHEEDKWIKKSNGLNFENSFAYNFYEESMDLVENLNYRNILMVDDSKRLEVGAIMIKWYNFYRIKCII